MIVRDARYHAKRAALYAGLRQFLMVIIEVAPLGIQLTLKIVLHLRTSCNNARSSSGDVL